METLPAVIIRRSNDENTVAIIEARRTGQVASPADLGRQIRSAVSEWINTTSRGKAALANSGNDFNVGDLAEWHRDESLLAILSKHGVQIIELDAVQAEFAGWDYDDHLFDEDKCLGASG
jgi:hypothetical protein